MNKSKFINKVIIFILIFSLSLGNFSNIAIAQTSVRPMAYTAAGVLAVGATASIQQQQKKCRETGVGCRTSNNSNSNRKSFGEIWKDVQNKQRINDSRYANYTNRNAVTTKEIFSGVGGWLKNAFAPKADRQMKEANQAQENLLLMINNAKSLGLPAEHIASLENSYRNIQQNQNAILQAGLQVQAQNYNSSSNVNSSWGNDVQSQDRANMPAPISTPTAMLPVNASPPIVIPSVPVNTLNANGANNRNDYIMVNPDVNHQGYNMGNGVTSNPAYGQALPAPVYVNPNAGNNQGLVNSQTGAIVTPVTQNNDNGIISNPQYEGEMQDNIIARNDEVIYPDNPKSSSESFRRYEKKAYININDGSIWEKDTSSHGGEQWKRWRNIRDWKDNHGKQSVWTDGRIRKEEK